MIDMLGISLMERLRKRLVWRLWRNYYSVEVLLTTAEAEAISGNPNSSIAYHVERFTVTKELWRVSSAIVKSDAEFRRHAHMAIFNGQIQIVYESLENGALSFELVREP